MESTLENSRGGGVLETERSPPPGKGRTLHALGSGLDGGVGDRHRESGHEGVPSRGDSMDGVAEVRSPLVSWTAAGHSLRPELRGSLRERLRRDHGRRQQLWKDFRGVAQSCLRPPRTSVRAGWGGAGMVVRASLAFLRARRPQRRSLQDVPRVATGWEEALRVRQPPVPRPRSRPACGCWRGPRSPEPRSLPAGKRCGEHPSHKTSVLPLTGLS